MSSASPPRVQFVGWSLEDQNNMEREALGGGAAAAARNSTTTKRPHHALPRRAKSLLSLNLSISSAADSLQMQLQTDSARSSFDDLPASRRALQQASCPGDASMESSDSLSAPSQQQQPIVADDAMMVAVDAPSSSCSGAAPAEAAPASLGITIPYTRCVLCSHDGLTD